MIYLKKEFHNKLISHAKSCYPNECCGYLLGKQDTKTFLNKVDEIFIMNNIHQNPQHFFMFDPQEQLDALIKAKTQEKALIGIFHSHPFTEAYPSDEDLKYIYDYRQSYCIISLQSEPIIKSFRITQEKIKEEKIKI